MEIEPTNPQPKRAGRPPKVVVETRQIEPTETRDFTTMAQREDAEDAHAHAERLRATRKPFGAMEQKLAYPTRKGYHRHWFNDHPGRISDAKAAGYEHVLGTDSKPVKRPVGTGRDKGVLMGYLMEIPEELWQEDQAKEQARADRVDASIARGKPITAEGEMDRSEASNFYSPTNAKVRHGTGRLPS